MGVVGFLRLLGVQKVTSSNLVGPTISFSPKPNKIKGFFVVAKNAGCALSVAVGRVFTTPKGGTEGGTGNGLPVPAHSCGKSQQTADVASAQSPRAP